VTLTTKLLDLFCVSEEGQPFMFLLKVCITAHWALNGLMLQKTTTNVDTSKVHPLSLNIQLSEL
jgi:hypothetical protein